MGEQSEGGGALSIGLLSVDKRKLLSPHDGQPDLFTINYKTGVSTEDQSRIALTNRRIIASSQSMLMPADDGAHKGYLMRESTRLNLEEYELTLFPKEDIVEFLQNSDPASVQSHFLRQIVKWMN